MFGVGTKGTAAAEYHEVVRRVAGMAADRNVGLLAKKHGLDVLSVTWEDTGRFKGSAVGPNISDMTIQVESHAGRGGPQLTCMPVIRTPNFADVSGDVPLDTFWLLVGNEKGEPLRRVSLRDFLSDLRAYLSDPASWPGETSSLLAGRDTHVLASAQACFLPIPTGGTAEFNPVLFNYQSFKGDPAVLAILATPEGTSVTVIDNVRDGFSAGGTWGQRLFFNEHGRRASLTGRQKSDYLKGPAETAASGDAAAPAEPTPVDREGLNMVLLIQVPLKQKEPERRFYSVDSMLCEFTDTSIDYCMAGGVEDAVIGHGRAEGPFTEVDGLRIERDERFPVRVTVQFYKATADGRVTEGDLAEIAGNIDRVRDRGRSRGRPPPARATMAALPPTGLPETWKLPATSCPASRSSSRPALPRLGRRVRERTAARACSLPSACLEDPGIREYWDRNIKKSGDSAAYRFSMSVWDCCCKKSPNLAEVSTVW